MMNWDTLIILLLTGTFFMVFMGLYKWRIETREKASENIHQLLTGTLPTQSAEALAKAAKKKQLAQTVLRRQTSKNPKAMAQANQLEKANWLLKPQEFLMLQLAASAGVALFAYMLKLPMWAVLPLGVGGYFIPLVALNIKVWLRMNKAAATFADVLDALVNCFKTGYGFNRAFQVIADGFDDPWGTEFGKMCTEFSLGTQADEVLTRLTDRIQSPDVDLFVTGLLIQRETGGNLAELLQNLSNICRDRQKLLRKVGAISAQGKLSAGIVICVPFLMFGMMFAVQPVAVTEFVTNIFGIILLCIAGFWMCCGIVVLWKIVQIEV
jgi:tight adherence protein B